MKNLLRFDWAIKRLLRNKANFGILEGFLSELLEEDIKIKEILEGESNKENADNKLNRVDILVKNSKGELIIIEIQNNYQADYLMRMLFGAAKLIVENMQEGMPYREVKKVISIHIIYFDMGFSNDYAYYGSTTFEGRNTHSLLHLSEQEQEILRAASIAQLFPQFHIIKVNDFDTVAKNTFDEWIIFLKTQEIKEGTKAKGLKEAKDKLTYLQLSDEEKLEYQKFVESWRDTQSAFVDNFNKGHYEGKEEGKMEEKIEMAKKCLKKGMLIADIAELTDLTEDEIRNISLG